MFVTPLFKLMSEGPGIMTFTPSEACKKKDTKKDGKKDKKRSRDSDSD